MLRLAGPPYSPEPDEKVIEIPWLMLKRLGSSRERPAMERNCWVALNGRAWFCSWAVSVPARSRTIIVGNNLILTEKLCMDAPQFLPGVYSENFFVIFRCLNCHNVLLFP